MAPECTEYMYTEFQDITHLPSIAIKRRIVRHSNAIVAMTDSRQAALIMSKSGVPSEVAHNSLRKYGVRILTLGLRRASLR